MSGKCAGLFAALAFVLIISVACPAAGADDPATVPADSLEAIQNILGKTVDLLWAESDLFFHDGYYERSIALLRIVVGLDPTDVDAYSVAQWLMSSLGRKDDALAFLQLGVAANPTSYDMYAELGQFHYMGRDYPKAAEAFEIAVLFEDCHHVVFRQLAHSYERSGRLKDSLRTWEYISATQDSGAVVQNNLERVRQKLEEQQGSGKADE